MEPGTSTSDERVLPPVEEMAAWLDGRHPGGDGVLASRARETMLAEVGPAVHMRGLLEFSNSCTQGCYYCGIRNDAGRSVRGVRRAESVPLRFTLSESEILDAARHCLNAGFGSMTLQSGERRDPAFVAFVERILRRIKAETTTPELPEGLGITLCVGEQRRDVYERFFNAGAHRYLLRIETSDPDLFARLHPPPQSFDRRVQALTELQEIGYQVGTGVMIGLPGQGGEELARDISFFAAIDADMIGMGPYIEAPGSAYVEMNRRSLLPAGSTAERLRRALRMIAVTRIALRDVNIAATTALQALSPTGREAGLMFGANVLMPIVTPGSRRDSYQLYQGKPCIDEAAEACTACIIGRAARVSRPVTQNGWGDAPHATRKGRIPA